jgi:ribose transport system substrate-binding protein
VAGLATCLAALVGAQVGSATQTAKVAAEYDAVVLNSFVGNPWRTLMQRHAEVLSKKPPLSRFIKSVRIVNSDNNPAAGSAAIRAAALEEPDILAIDAVSATGQNQAVQEACKKGIIVVAFDILVTAPCAWKVGLDFNLVGRTWADWLARAVGGKGEIIMDLGTAGAKASDDINSAAKKVFKRYPGIKVVGTFYGNYNAGDERTGVTKLIRAHPNIVGVFTQDFGGESLLAIKDAGFDPRKVAVTGFAYNQSLKACKDLKGKCLLISSPSWVSAVALQTGVDVLQKKLKGTPRFLALKAPLFTDTKFAFNRSGLGKLYPLVKSYDPKLPPGTSLPLSPPWAKVTVAEVKGAL